MKGTYRSLKPLVHWRSTDRPPDWSSLFGRTAPLEIEIGFGNGEFLIRQAQENGDHDYVGVELHWESAKRLLRRIHHTGVANVRVLLGDARVILEMLFLPQRANRIYSLFPCPWPKDRHEGNRLFGGDFLRLMNSRIAEGGDARIVTDHEAYFHWIREQVPGSGFELDWKTIPPMHGTKYERKWQNEGQQLFFDLHLSKIIHQDIPLKEDVELKIYNVKQFDPDTFEPAGSRGDVAVVFKDFFFDRKRERGAVKAFVSEEDLQQTVWIEIARKGEGWIIRPLPGAGALPTRGVQLALDLVSEAAGPGG